MIHIYATILLVILIIVALVYLIYQNNIKKYFPYANIVIALLLSISLIIFSIIVWIQPKTQNPKTNITI